MMRTQDKLKKITKDKDLLKAKRSVLKQYPGAHIRLISDSYEVCDKSGFPIRRPDLFLPKFRSPREAWTIISQTIWFDKMIAKSNKAFSDDKIWKKLEKKEERETTPKSKSNELY